MYKYMYQGVKKETRREEREDFCVCVFIKVSKIGLVSIDDILRGVRERLQDKREGGGSQKIKRLFE